MPHGTALNQMANLFREILSMVSGPFQSLRHEEDFETQGDVAGLPAYLPRVDAGAQCVHLAIEPMSGESGLHVALRVGLVNQCEHLLKNLAHIMQVGAVLRRELIAVGSSAADDREHKVSYAFEIEHKLQTRKQLRYLLRRCRSKLTSDAVVDVAIDLVEFSLTFLYRDESQGRGVCQALGHVRHGVPCDEARMRA